MLLNKSQQEEYENNHNISFSFYQYVFFVFTNYKKDINY